MYVWRATGKTVHISVDRQISIKYSFHPFRLTRKLEFDVHANAFNRMEITFGVWTFAFAFQT